jgi:molybdenum cofactor guanylyltransferase
VPSASSLTFAILAGGAATRLAGRDKGLEPLDGRPLVAWLIDAIAGMVPFVSAADILIVANRHHDMYARHARTIADIVPGFQAVWPRGRAYRGGRIRLA